jgi:hypothetical protein
MQMPFALASPACGSPAAWTTPLTNAVATETVISQFFTMEDAQSVRVRGRFSLKQIDGQVRGAKKSPDVYQNTRI